MGALPFEKIKASLREEFREEFPAWAIIIVGGRWWAIRGALSSEQPGETSCVDADSPEELRVRLHLVEARHPKPAGEVVFRLPADQTLSGPDAPA